MDWANGGAEQALIISYHFTLRSINLQKEIIPALFAFCAASFVSMCLLLVETRFCGVVAAAAAAAAVNTSPAGGLVR